MLTIIQVIHVPAFLQYARTELASVAPAAPEVVGLMGITIKDEDRNAQLQLNSHLVKFNLNISDQDSQSILIINVKTNERQSKLSLIKLIRRASESERVKCVFIIL